MEIVKGFSSERGKCTGHLNAENGIKRRSDYPTGNEGRTEEGHTGADEARAKQAKAKKTSVRCVLEQREEQKQRTDGTEGHF